ncbi:hypothetical protein JX266_005568 [Neoarthrinium moseri]|nr:hypothetical protein JX266_005568 [Neoarthrinium moseri]
MSSPGNQPQLPPDQDRGPALEALYWTLSAFSILLLSLRFYARTRIGALGWDDWMMLITVVRELITPPQVLFVVATCFVTYMASIGGARHIFYLDDEQRQEAIKWSWIAQPWAIFLFATGKASVAILTLRFIGRNTFWRKYTLYFIIVTIFIINSLGCIFTFVQCDPPRALWTAGIPAKCWDPKVQTNFNYFLAAWNIGCDIVLALLPASFISKLNLDFRRKLALCVLLGLGLFDAVFSGIKVKFLIDLTARADFTWSLFDVQVWTAIEAFVMIACGSLPPLQPLWDRFVTHKRDASYGRTPLKYSGGSSKNSDRVWPGVPSLNSSHNRNQYAFDTPDVSQLEHEMPSSRYTIHRTTDVKVERSHPDMV